MLAGGILSATDPVAVVALLREMGVKKSLATLIEAESLMNDGTAVVVFTIFLKAVRAGSLLSWLAGQGLSAVSATAAPTRAPWTLTHAFMPTSMKAAAF